MIFKDRSDAGRQLVPHLLKHQNAPETVVIGLPRGGVVNAAEVARGLNLPLDVIVPRKIGAPFQTELAIGAITETGEGLFDESLIERFNISQDYINKMVAQEKAVAQRRLQMYRKSRSKIPLEGKTVILVDDGLATGATMKAAIKSVQAEGAIFIIVAVPIAPPDTVQEIQALADEVIVLDTPTYFYAVGQFYEDFSQTEDDEVISLLNS